MLASGRFLWKNVDSVPKVLPTVRQYSAARQSEVGVTIPKRIERRPTDILKALSSTVQRDPTAFAYIYPDDPHFYPFSNTEKRIYALSLESGRKSAKWIIEQNPGFFKNQLSDPPIKAFLPKVIYDENSEVTEETLVEVIERQNVADAIVVYKLLLQKDIVISNHVKQSLLELVCFYNSGEKPNEEELESKWYSNVESVRLSVNTWREQSFAETLFASMDPDCPLANSTIIQGMIKYNNVQKALEIFNKAKSNNVKFAVGVYNALLSQASNSSADIGDGLEFINKLLKEMASEKINPNLGTLNAALQSLMHLQLVQRNDDYVMKLVMEFVHLGISPSLGTYHYLFRIFGHSRRNADRNRRLFSELLDVVQNTKHEMRHPSDLLFFPNVMNFLATVSKDIMLMNQLNMILFRDDNLKFLENSVSESMYFREYIRGLFRMEPIEIAMQKYRELVPTIYSPELNILTVVLSAIIENNAFEYLIEFWDDLKRLKMSKYMKLLHKIFPLAKVLTEEVALKVVHEAALNGITYFEQSGFASGSQEDVSHLLIALLKTGEEENAFKMFAKAKDVEHTGALVTADAVMELFQCALTKRKVPIIMDCLRYADAEFYSEVGKMAELALPLLGENERTWATQVMTKAKEREQVEESSPE